MKRFAIALCLSLFAASVADAGPILDRIKERRAARSCNTCAPAKPVASQVASNVKPAVYTLPSSSVGGCVGGQCPAPVQRRGLFR